MDPQALHDCFAATLNANQDIRRHAENQLREAQKSLGFLGACMDILSTDQVDPGVQKAASIYFKNRIVRNWGAKSSENDPGIDQDEKPIIKERLVPAIVAAPPSIRSQLFPVLSTILAYDFPTKWPEFLPTTLKLISDTSNFSSVYAGLMCFAEVCRSFRWKDNHDRSSILDPLIVQYFPALLQIGKHILDTPEMLSQAEAGDMVKLILKIFKFVTYYDLPEPLQNSDVILEWISFHGAVFNLNLPQSILHVDQDERKMCPLVKAQKWSIANINRVFKRYGTKECRYRDFAIGFGTGVIPELMKMFLSRIAQWCNGQVWLSSQCLYLVLTFLEQCITPKESWLLLKEHVPTIVEHFLFPLLKPSDQTLEMFEDDPQEYIHMILDVYEEESSPDMAACSLLYTLVEKRSKTTLEPILQFVYGKLTHLQGEDGSLDNAKQKEAALRTVGAVSHKLTSKKSPVLNQMEQFLVGLVFPAFNSQFGFLRARTCEVACKFSTISFTSESNMAILFNGVFQCFQDDSNLPVQLEGALALQAFIELESFKEALSAIIIPTMERLLALSNKIDNDAISVVIQECVENFSEQLQPFGMSLMEKLSQQAMRILPTLVEAANVDPDDLDGSEDNTDKEMAVIGVFNTMTTVLLSFENSNDIVYSLEKCYAPVLQYVLVNGMEDFFGEIAELMENTTFLTRSVSPTMWPVYEQLLACFHSGDGMLYLEEIAPALKNCIVYGAEYLKTNAAYSNAFFKLIEAVFGAVDREDTLMGSDEITVGADLAHTFILSLQEDCEPFLPSLITFALNELSYQDPAHKQSHFTVVLCNIILAGLVNRTSTTLQVLIEVNSLLPFFQAWVSILPTLQGVFDLKLSILGLLALTKLSLDNLKSIQVDSALPELGLQLAQLLGKLPFAIQNLEKKRAEFNPATAPQQDDLYDFGGDQEWEDEDDTNDKKASDDYLKFLHEQSAKLDNSGYFGDEEEDDLLDDPLAITPLDSVNVFGVFKDNFVGLQSEQEKYALLCGKLGDDEKDVIQQVVGAEY